jgi:hypothetical protein
MSRKITLAVLCLRHQPRPGVRRSESMKMKMTATHHIGVGLVGVLTALGITAEPAHAGRHARSNHYAAAAYARRHRACVTAYDTQANPNYGFGPLVCVEPTDVVSGDRIIGRDPSWRW